MWAGTPITDTQVASYVAQGFELAPHVDSGPTCSNWTYADLYNFYSLQIATFQATWPSVPAPQTHRMHCISWTDYDSQPLVELAHGMRLDTNYYYFPDNFVQGRTGMFNGTGMPMRFVDRNGNTIDVHYVDASSCGTPGVAAQLFGSLGAAGVNWGGEIIYKAVPDLPDPSVTRFGRVDVFGQGPVNGVCPPPAAPTQCSTDGYVSRNALGYRLVAGLRYANVADGVDLIPSLLFGQDVSGWSGDGGILEGRKLAVLSLRINTRSGFTADIAWVPTWGGTYNNQRDRSAVLTYVGQRF